MKKSRCVRVRIGVPRHEAARVPCALRLPNVDPAVGDHRVPTPRVFDYVIQVKQANARGDGEHQKGGRGNLFRAKGFAEVADEGIEISSAQLEGRSQLFADRNTKT